MADEVKITQPPSPKPKNLILRRGSDNDGASVEALWGVPANALTQTHHRWTELDEYWTFKASKNMSNEWTQQRGEGHAMKDKVWVRDKGPDHQSNTMWYNRTKYHPMTIGRYLTTVTCTLKAKNPKGSVEASHSIAFQLPPKPTFQEPELDSSNQAVTFTIERPDVSGMQEMHDIRYCIARRDCKALNTAYSGKWVEGTWANTTEDTQETTANFSLGRNLAVGEWVLLECRAYSRGVRGDSAVATKRYVYGYPAYAYIESVKATSRDSNASVYIDVAIAYATEYSETAKKKVRTNLDPVDEIKLQVLYNTALSTQAAADDSNNWVDVSGAVDDGECIGFYDNATDARPAVGNHTWYRVVTTHGPFQRVSHAYEAQCLFRKADEVSNDKAYIASLAPGSDGESIEGVVAWKSDDSTTTEISWSDHQGAWWSNDQPDSMDVTWADSTSKVSGWPHSASFYIRGLEAGKSYFVRARRKQVDGDTVTNGPWQFPDAEHYPVSLYETPEDVRLSAPAIVERGSGVPCNWSFTGPEQKEWKLFKRDFSGATERGRQRWAGKAGPEQSVTLPGGGKVAQLRELVLYVEVTCGGTWAKSNEVTVVIDEAPTINITTASILRAQPATVHMVTDQSTASVALTVRSHLGVVSEMPDGDSVQEDGDVVWTAELAPGEIGWAPMANGGYWADYELPEGLDLRENATYEVVAVAKSSYGLASTPDYVTFSVSWSHQAVAPTEAEIEIDRDALTATITPQAPEGAAETDVCDVYRLTPDGAYLIAQDLAFGTTVMDPYCPYASMPGVGLAYRLCTRTVDGDVEWADFPYELRRSSMRVDWAGRSVTLPYDVVVSYSWSKGFELSERLDGSRVGGWDAGATKEATVTLDLMRWGMSEEAELVRQLAKAAQPCFVRTHDGCAYEADVQVDNMEVGFGQPSVPISLKLTEVDLGEEFWAVPVDDGGGA